MQKDKFDIVIDETFIQEYADGQFNTELTNAQLSALYDILNGNITEAVHISIQEVLELYPKKKPTHKKKT